MGERKGTNLYYPPDYDPKKGGLNKFLGTHALRERARKLHMGILIIRFEMPYNIWCEGCNDHIGMGVRYNAEKKKVGMYYSTPVYQFRMKCHLCDNHFEIKTDPANFDYVIVSGARRQENRWDPTQNEQVVPEEKETSKRLFDDAMFKLEHGSKDQKGAKSLVPTLSQLAAMRDDRWQDDYSANCTLRQNFRAAKRVQKKIEAKDRALTGKFGLDLPLLPEVDSDVHLAKLLSLKPAQSILERQFQSRQAIIERPVLPSSKVISKHGLIKPLKRSLTDSDITKRTPQILVKKRKREADVNVTLNIVTKKKLEECIEIEPENVYSISEKNSTRMIEKVDKQNLNILACSGKNEENNETSVEKVTPETDDVEMLNSSETINNSKPQTTTIDSNLVNGRDDKTEKREYRINEKVIFNQTIPISGNSDLQEVSFTSLEKPWVQTFMSPTCTLERKAEISTELCGETSLDSLQNILVTENRSTHNTKGLLKSINKHAVSLVDSEYHGSTSSDSDELTTC